MSEKLLKTHDLALALGVSIDTIGAYRKKGLLPVKSDGKSNWYSLSATKEWRDNNIRKLGDKLENNEDSLDVVLKRVKIRQLEAAADIKEIERLERLGEVVSSETAIDLFTKEVFTLKTRLEQLAQPLAQKLYSEQNQKVCQEIIEKEIETVLSELTLHHMTPASFGRMVNKLNNKNTTEYDDSDK